MHKIMDFLSERISSMTGITVGSSAVGTVVGAVEDATIAINTDLLSLLQYGSYALSMIVAVLTIITWCRKNRQKN